MLFFSEFIFNFLILNPFLNVKSSPSSIVFFMDNNFIFCLFDILAFTQLFILSILSILLDGGCFEWTPKGVCIFILVELSKHFHLSAIWSLKNKLAFTIGMLVFPKSFIELFIGLFLLDSVTIVVVVFEVAFVPIAIWVNLLSIGILSAIRPISNLKIIFWPIVQSKSISTEVLLNCFLEVSMVPF